MYLSILVPKMGLEVVRQYWPLTATALAVSLFLAYLLYRLTTPPVSRLLRGILFGFRFGALFLLLLLLLEPVITLTTVHRERPVIAILADHSASMSITDQKGNRAAVLEDLLHGEAIQDLSAAFDLRSFQFAAEVSLQRAARQDSGFTLGKTTDIGRALQTARDSLQAANLQAMILLTDGANNMGQDPGQTAKNRGVPIYTIGIGDSAEPVDANITQFSTNEITYAGANASVVTAVTSSGLAGRRVPVELRDGNMVLDSQYLQLSSDGNEQTITLNYTPQIEGLRRLTISIPVQDGEMVIQNNRRDLLVKVLRSKIRVLLIAGSPGPEASFLRRCLDANEDMETTFVVPRRSGGYYGPPLPQTEEELREFDVIVIVAVPRRLLGTPFETMLHDAVTAEGKSLLFSPGQSGETWTAYAQSPLADILPVEILTQGETFVSSPFSPALTSAGISHQVTRLDDDPAVNERKWSEMPPLLGIMRNSLPKPQATVLATHPLSAAEQDNPLPFLAIMRLPKGKTMVMNGLPLWRWNFMMWGIGKDGNDYVRFMTNTMKWLSTQEKSSLLNVATSRPMYHSGEPVLFLAQTYDEQYRPLAGAEVEVTIVSRDTSRSPFEPGEVTLSLTEAGEAGHYEGRLPTIAPGDYQFAGKASHRGRALGQDSGSFSVEEYSLEFANTRMNVELLRRIAAMSGAQYYDADNCAAITSQLQPRERLSPRQRHWALWGNPYLLGAFLLFVFTEWAIRKRKGMV